MNNQIWCVPLGTDLALVYAPYHGLTTLVNRASAELLRSWLLDNNTPVDDALNWITGLGSPGNEPKRKEGAPDPLYLGLIPTRACMLRCAYCDFPSQTASVMSFTMIRKTVDGYAALLRQCHASEWQMHFFGGEPFAAYKEIVFALNYAQRQADELGIPPHFEVTTNGFYSEEKAHWIADKFDTVVLSMDGFPEAQNRHRPAPGGRDSFPTVCRSADIFARGNCELIIRSCISSDNTDDLADWAAFVADRFFPAAVVLEPMIESTLSRRNGLHAPEPDNFIRNWTKAYRVLHAEGIPLIYSSGEVTALKTSLCPMGRDAVIVSPDGALGGCWQLAETWKQEGVDLKFGEITEDGMQIDIEALNRQRDLSETNRQRCRNCFCFAHCAGGCLLNRNRNTEFCRMTRALTLWQLLERLGHGALADHLISSGSFIDRLAGMTDFSCSDEAFDMWQTDGLEVALHASSAVSRGKRVRISDFPDPDDPVSGWICEGRTYRIIDAENRSVKILDGAEALSFQLEHSGMSDAETKAVRDALEGGNL